MENWVKLEIDLSAGQEITKSEKKPVSLSAEKRGTGLASAIRE